MNIWISNYKYDKKEDIISNKIEKPRRSQANFIYFFLTETISLT